MATATGISNPNNPILTATTVGSPGHGNTAVANTATAPGQVRMASTIVQNNSAGLPFQSQAQQRTAADPSQTAFYNALPKYYAGSTVANLTPEQIAAKGMISNQAQANTGVIGNVLNNWGNTTPAANSAQANVNLNQNATAPIVGPNGVATAAVNTNPNVQANNVNTAATVNTPAAFTQDVGMRPDMNNALTFALGDILNQGNPYAQASMDSATRQITDNFVQSVLPKLGSVAQQSGAWGGSRQGIVEGLAAGETAKAVGDTASQLAAKNYETSLNTFNNALGVGSTLRGQDVTQRNIASNEGLTNRQLDVNSALQNRQISSQEGQANQSANLSADTTNANIGSNEALNNRQISSQEGLAKMQADLQVAVQNGQISEAEAAQRLQVAAAQATANRQIDSSEGLTNRQLTIAQQIEQAQTLPALLNASYQPAQMLDAVGADNRAYDQQLIDADVARNNYGQNIDAERLAQFNQILSGGSTSGISQGGTTTQTSKTGSTSAVQNALGGAAAGATLGSLTSLNNGGEWGAVLGALAGYLS